MKRGQVFEWLLVKSGYSVEPILKFFYLLPSGAFVGKCCFPGTTKKGEFQFLTTRPAQGGKLSVIR
jgi:hypothetical protein